jgi:hypothetical protein
MPGWPARTRNDALVEAEALLATSSIGHNHLHFRRYAIDACLASEDWDGAVRDWPAIPSAVDQELERAAFLLPLRICRLDVAT